VLEPANRLLLQPGEASCRSLAETTPLTRPEEQDSDVNRGFRSGEIPPLPLIERRDIRVEIVVLD